MKYTTGDWYDTPLYYDIIFDTDTEKECDFLEVMRQRYCLTRGKRVLEPACGSGRLLAGMARRGYDVTGLDLSPNMVNFARQRLEKEKLRGRVDTAAMQDFRYPKPFDLAHCLISTFKYLLTEEDARAHLQCVANALKPGGIYVLGFHLSDYSDTRKSRERWTGKRGNVEVVCNIQGWPADPRTRLEKTRSRLIVHRNGQTLRHETVWYFRTYDAAQVRSLLRSVPDFEHIATYDFTYNPDEPRDLDDDQLDTILILRKKG